MMARGPSSRCSSGQKSLVGRLVNKKGPLPPGFFVSVDSKGLGSPVSGVESTLAGSGGSVDSNVFTGDIIGRVVWDKERLEQEGGADGPSENNM
jgi:hypothetical protein